MQAEAHADRPRCDNAVSSERSNRPKRGLWMPWNDNRVEQLAEAMSAQWAEVRRDGQKQTPPLPAKKSIASAKPTRGALAIAIAIAAGGDAISGALAVLSLQVLASGPKRLTGMDGSATFAKTRSGACTGYGGLREFYGR